MIYRVICYGLLAFSLATARTAEAQTGPSSTDDVPVEALELEAVAQGLLHNLNLWYRASSLYRRAADLRAEGSFQRIQDLLYAGWLAYYVEDERAALTNLTRAAEEARSVGDVVAAANAYLDAAHVAGQLGRKTDMEELFDNAHLLSRSPLLSELDRRSLTARLDLSLAADAPEEGSR